MPPQPHRFFSNIFKYVISAGKGQVVLARFSGQVIAGCIYFHFRNKALYKFGASDMTYQHMRPNDLVMWEAIKWYAANGYERFCFGRTSMNNEGLRRFKSDWGTEERIVNYYRYDLKLQDYVTSEPTVKSSHKRLFQQLPVPALKFFGAVLYKHMG
jgi:lipid II:glycine glycyltransferase (peptidoglycan interpeptide bridge formation enzyme)